MSKIATSAQYLISDASATTLSEDVIGHVPFTPEIVTQRALGAYYTPQSVASYMADWVVRSNTDRIVEPSFGDGIFLYATADAANRKRYSDVSIYGYEIDRKTIDQVSKALTLSNVSLVNSDYLEIEPLEVDAIIGNPPYVRLRQLDEKQRANALLISMREMGYPMDSAGSLWMPFLLHATSFLKMGGRLAFVLPYEVTYVKYARPLWRFLARQFGSLQILRTHERLFTDIYQDVVILLADEFGGKTDVVSFKAFEQVQDLLESRPTIDRYLSCEDLARGERLFVNALLSPGLVHLLKTKVAQFCVESRNLVTFNIGYVAGDKEFFHPGEDDIRKYELPARSLYPSLTSTRSLKNAGLRSSQLETANTSKLFLPDPKQLSEGERAYIQVGVDCEVASRYKCRIRKPWYKVPGVKVPDVVLSVFSERPFLLINDAEYFASNSLLCGYGLRVTKEQLVTSWYTSLTLLQCELEIHALGGGVMVLIPGEAGKIKLPQRVTASDKHLENINHLLITGNLDKAYRLGDDEVLVNQFNLTQDEIQLIREGVQILTHWRTSVRSSKSQHLNELSHG